MAENFNESPSMRAVEKILHARASQPTSNLCKQFEQRPTREFTEVKPCLLKFNCIPVSLRFVPLGLQLAVSFRFVVWVTLYYIYLGLKYEFCNFNCCSHIEISFPVFSFSLKVNIILFLPMTEFNYRDIRSRNVTEERRAFSSIPSSDYR